MSEGAAVNTDREIYREPPGDYYADSVHITEGGGLGINAGGMVTVMPLRQWAALAADLLETQRAAALLKTTAETLNQVVTNMARELGCEADNEVMMAAIAGLKRDAGRYRFIRNVHADDLGKAGRPCVADPDGPKQGRYVSEQDADEAIDKARGG